jgi:hypothetical protein
MPTLPSDLAAFATLLDGQPALVRDNFNYCLCLMMVEADWPELLQIVPGMGRSKGNCRHPLRAAEKYALAGPPLSQQQNVEMIEMVRELCKLDETDNRLMRSAMAQLNLSARAVHCVLKIGRTIAGSAGEDPQQRSRRRLCNL